MVKALASHQCDTGSISARCHMRIGLVLGSCLTPRVCYVVMSEVPRYFQVRVGLKMRLDLCRKTPERVTNQGKMGKIWEDSEGLRSINLGK